MSEEEFKRGSRRGRVSEVRAVIPYRSKEEQIARHLGINTSSINRVGQNNMRCRSSMINI